MRYSIVLLAILFASGAGGLPGGVAHAMGARTATEASPVKAAQHIEMTKYQGPEFDLCKESPEGCTVRQPRVDFVIAAPTPLSTHAEALSLSLSDRIQQSVEAPVFNP